MLETRDASLFFAHCDGRSNCGCFLHVLRCYVTSNMYVCVVKLCSLFLCLLERYNFIRIQDKLKLKLITSVLNTSLSNQIKTSIWQLQTFGQNLHCTSRWTLQLWPQQSATIWHCKMMGFYYCIQICLQRHISIALLVLLLETICVRV